MMRLYYTSHLVEGTTQTDIEDILRVSRKNNAADDITGMLILNGLRILQFLEGPGDKVEACYKRICKDRRHTSVDFTSRSEAEMRVFSNWSMGLRKVSDLPEDLAQSVRALIDVKSHSDAAGTADLAGEEKDVARMTSMFLKTFEAAGEPATD